MWNARLDESQAGIKTAGESINNLRYIDYTTLMAESEEELVSSWVKGESEKASLKLNIKKLRSLEKTLMLWKIESRKRRRQQSTRWLDGITDSTDMYFSKLWEVVEDKGAWRAAVHGIVKSRIRLSD